MNRVLTCLALASLSIAPVSNAAFLDTYVEPCLFDCGGTFNPLNPPGHGAAGTGTELDLGNSGCTWTSGATAEDADGDPVFTTIHAALANTTAGGTVHLLIPGI